MKQMIKHCFLLLLSICMISTNVRSNSLLDSAQNAYDRQDFTKAAQFYNTLCEMDPQNVELHYNLGNAHFKNKALAKSILHYEKALKLYPQHQDAAHNLKIANQKTVDKIESIPNLFIYRWWRSIYNLYPADTWASISIALMALSLIGISIFLFMSEVKLKKIGFYGALFNLVFALICVLLAVNQKSYVNSASFGIIMEASVNVISSPSSGSSQLFVLHEGTKVKIKSEDKLWIRIALPNGNEGWIEGKNIASI